MEHVTCLFGGSCEKGILCPWYRVEGSWDGWNIKIRYYAVFKASLNMKLVDFDCICEKGGFYLSPQSSPSDRDRGYLKWIEY